jgi:hypothetical protein
MFSKYFLSYRSVSLGITSAISAVQSNSNIPESYWVFKINIYARLASKWKTWSLSTWLCPHAMMYATEFVFVFVFIVSSRDPKLDIEHVIK